MNKLHLPRFFSKAVFIVFLFVVGFVGSYLVNSNSQTKAHQQITQSFLNCEQHALDQTGFERSERYYCYLKSIEQAIRANGLESMVEAFTQYQGTEQGELLRGARCHSIGHLIGEVAVDEGIEPEILLRQCTTICPYDMNSNVEGVDLGCLNGASHAFLLSSQSVSQAQEYCATQSDDPEVEAGCFHGVGHGIAELVQFNISDGLEKCNQLIGEEAQYQCGHAVLMEPLMVEYAPLQTVPEDMNSFCSTTPEIYQKSCYEFSGFLTFVRTADVFQATQTCSSVPSNYAKDCFFRLGEVATIRYGLKSTELADSCQAVQGLENQKACIEGIVSTLLYSPNISVSQVIIDWCEDSFTEQLQQICVDRAEEMITVKSL
jgi:hypothetical protein